MDKSFSNIKKDIGSLSSWITHFKGKHDEHEGSFDKIMKDIESIKDMFENSWSHTPLSIQINPQSALSVYGEQTKIYSGIEAKAVDLEGNIDAREEFFHKVDLVLGSLHRIPDGKEKYL